MKPLTTFALSLVLGAAASASVPDAPEFGPMNGAYDQTLRVKIIAGTNPAESYMLNFSYQDLLGRQIGAAQQIVLAPGQIHMQDFHFRTVAKAGTRATVRPVVKYLEGSGKCRFVADLYDTVLGRTATLGSPATGINFVPVALAYGQTCASRLARPQAQARAAPEPPSCRAPAAVAALASLTRTSAPSASTLASGVGSNSTSREPSASASSSSPRFNSTLTPPTA